MVYSSRPDGPASTSSRLKAGAARLVKEEQYADKVHERFVNHCKEHQGHDVLARCKALNQFLAENGLWDVEIADRRSSDTSPSARQRGSRAGAATPSAQRRTGGGVDEMDVRLLGPRQARQGASSAKRASVTSKLPDRNFSTAPAGSSKPRHRAKRPENAVKDLQKVMAGIEAITREARELNKHTGNSRGTRASRQQATRSSTGGHAQPSQASCASVQGSQAQGQDQGPSSGRVSSSACSAAHSTDARQFASVSNVAERSNDVSRAQPAAQIAQHSERSRSAVRRAWEGPEVARRGCAVAQVDAPDAAAITPTQLKPEGIEQYGAGLLDLIDALPQPDAPRVTKTRATHSSGPEARGPASSNDSGSALMRTQPEAHEMCGSDAAQLLHVINELDAQADALLARDVAVRREPAAAAALVPRNSEGGRSDRVDLSASLAALDADVAEAQNLQAMAAACCQHTSDSPCLNARECPAQLAASIKAKQAEAAGAQDQQAPDDDAAAAASAIEASAAAAEAEAAADYDATRCAATLCMAGSPPSLLRRAANAEHERVAPAAPAREAGCQGVVCEAAPALPEHGQLDSVTSVMLRQQLSAAPCGNETSDASTSEVQTKCWDRSLTGGECTLQAQTANAALPVAQAMPRPPHRTRPCNAFSRGGEGDSMHHDAATRRTLSALKVLGAASDPASEGGARFEGELGRLRVRCAGELRLASARSRGDVGSPRGAASAKVWRRAHEIQRARGAQELSKIGRARQVIANVFSGGSAWLNGSAPLRAR